ncbi:NUDIX domain-containing protein [Patescibacteria group bacterium]
MNEFGVAAKAIIKDGDGRYLILHKSDLEDVNPNEADIPGGRLEFGEDIKDCLAREVSEEVGLSVKIKEPTRVWGFVKQSLHLVGITFLAEVIGGEINLSSEHESYKWVTKEEIQSGEYPEWLKNEFLELDNC